MVHLWVVPSLIASFICLVIGTYTFSKNPRGYINRLFYVLMILVVLVGCGSAVLHGSAIEEAALYGGKIMYAFNTLLIGVVVHLSLIFPKEKKFVKKRLNLLFLYIPIFVFAIITWLFVQVEKGPWGVFEVSGKIVVHFHIFVLIIYSGIAVYSLVTSYFVSYGVMRGQTIFMILGILSPMIIGTTFAAVKHGFNIDLPPFVSLGTFIMAFLFSYAIVRYKMLVIEPVTGFSTTSYCGVNCGICKKFIERGCLGCKNDVRHEKCAVYLCTQKKKIDDCSFCPQLTTCKRHSEKASACYMPMPKYYINEGIYLIKEPKAEHSLRIFIDTISMGVRGLCITRQYPEAVREKYGLKMVPILWLSTVQGENNIEPTKIERLSSVISDFINKSDNTIVLLDGLEYLVTNNDFQGVLRLINFVSEGIAVKKSRLVIPINPLAFKEKELALLERDMIVLDADKIKIHGTLEKTVMEQMLER